MRIDTLYEFMLLASNLSFTDTAKSFYISQSVLSNHISNLEKELGVKLFVRDNRSVTLSEVGRLFLKDAENITAAYEQAIDNIAIHERGASSRIRIGLLLGTFGSFLPALCHHYRELHPEVDFTFKVLDIGQVHSALKDELIDVGFTVFSQEMQGADYDYRTIYEDRYKLAMSKGHRLATRQSINLADLKGEDVIAPRFNPLRGTLAQINIMMQNAGVEIRVDHSIVDAASLMTTLVATDQVAVALDHLGIYDRENLAFVPIDDERTKIYAGPMWRRTNESGTLGPFIDYIVEETRGLGKDTLPSLSEKYL